jgi:pilus assembly protein Flp/PilA
LLITLLRGVVRRRPGQGADEGATAVEYALLIGLIVVIVIAAVTLLGGDLGALATGVAQHVSALADDGS